jgi:hypothetical protein
MASHIERRKFLGAAATWPLVALAQQPTVPTIGGLVIGNISPEQFWREFRQGLRDLGYVEGRSGTRIPDAQADGPLGRATWRAWRASERSSLGLSFPYTRAFNPPSMTQRAGGWRT